MGQFAGMPVCGRMLAPQKLVSQPCIPKLLLSAPLLGHSEAPDSSSELGREISHPFMIETNLAGLLESIILLVLCLEIYYHHCCHHSPIHKVLS